MPRTLQIRDLDDDVYEALRRHAAQAGLSVPEPGREAARLAARPTVEEWPARTSRQRLASSAVMLCATDNNADTLTGAPFAVTA